jgi:KipI family sensor histidine kinase inhibitor
MSPWVPYGTIGWFAEFTTVEEADAHQRALLDTDPGLDVRRGWRSLMVATDARTPPSLPDLGGSSAGMRAETRRDRDAVDVRVPVVYDGDDLGEVAERTGLTMDEVVAAHTAPTYRVVMLGFTRAFPYLSGLDPRLHLPRRDSPRPRVPPGSVAIAGDQAGIYPSASPGGWHLLGRTDLALFDPHRDPPNLFAAGMLVRFEAVDR